MRALLINLQLLTTFWKLLDAHVNMDVIVGSAAVGNLEFLVHLRVVSAEVSNCTNSSTNLFDVLLNVEGDPLNELD